MLINVVNIILLFLLGNVHLAEFQFTKQDYFAHFYTYDADNRLQAAHTSKDGLNWERDANYDYYQHGIMARKNIGKLKLQGLDHIYTLQGWLRGMNHAQLDPTLDPGRDGIAGNPYCKDVVGYALHYFEGDYNSVSGQNIDWGVHTSRTNLYNGNISAITTGIAGFDLPQQKIFAYDRLNRLKQQNVFNYDGNSWVSPHENYYKTAYEYNQNGGMTTLVRYDEEGNLIDDFEFKYLNPLNNRLTSLVENAVHPRDLDDQKAGTNYTYSELGELKSDSEAGIIEIVRRADQKVTKIIKTDATLEFEYDPFGRRILKRVTKGETVKTTHYYHDAAGNLLTTYEESNDSPELIQKSCYIYGSERVGEIQVNRSVDAPISETKPFMRGEKRYEVSNHTGNVLAVISDKRTWDAANQCWLADIKSAQDYYPYGMTMPGRTLKVINENYRYGFNTQEKVDEIAGEDNHYTAEFWEYGVRPVLRWNVDPRPNPSLSPYAVLGGNPILYSDHFGDTLDICDNAESQNDVLSLAKVENQAFVCIDNNRVTLDFGDMGEKEKGEIMKSDEGLALINDLASSDKKFLYEASDFALLRSEKGQSMYQLLYKDDNLIINASDFGKDSNEQLRFRPKFGYEGHVIIHPDAKYLEKDYMLPINDNDVLKPRRSLVFHELSENYQRTHNNINYWHKLDNKEMGAHYLAIERGNIWWGKSLQPGHISSALPVDKPSDERRRTILKVVKSYYNQYPFYNK